MPNLFPIRTRIFLAGLLGLLGAGCTTLTASEPESATGFAPRPVHRAEQFMVAAANPHAVRTGVEILRRGGSAVDAAIAVQLVLNLVEPQSSGVGGGGFMLHWQAGARRLSSYDGRESAPQSARPEMFLDAGGTPMRWRAAARGGRAVAVPGLLRMFEAAHRDHGRLPWHDLFLPAIRLAERGFAVSPRLHGLLRRASRLGQFPAAARYFLDSKGNPWPVGYLLTNRAFAETLRLLARGGAKAFYTGPLARNIAAAVGDDLNEPGTLDPADLAAYRAKRRKVPCATYRRHKVCSMGPPSSGGLTIAMILGLLEGFDLRRLDPGEPKAIHLFAEASRLAYADRAAYMADPDLSVVPATRLLDPAYLDRRRRQIDPARSMGRAAPGLSGTGPTSGAAPESPSTTHISIVDRAGNAVALTSSINYAFGSYVSVGGFLLNNHMLDFDFTPARNGRATINRVEPGKRPRSSMAPTMVFDSEGRLKLVLGSPGGSNIIPYVAQAILGVLDWDLELADVVAAPHYAAHNRPATYLEAGTSLAPLKPALEALGHKIKFRSMTSGLHIISRDDDRWVGAADPRREGRAMGD